MREALNARSDWNVCAQAVVVDTLMRLRVMPRVGPDGESAAEWRRVLLARVLSDYPPDVPLGLGTSVWRLVAALRGYGVAARLVASPPFARSPGRVLEQLSPSVAAGLPVIVCVDDGLLGGQPWAAHWTRMAALDSHEVTLADGDATGVVPRERFMAAWRCRALPWPHGWAGVLVGP